MEAIDSKPPLFTNRSLFNMTLPVALDALLALVAGLLDSAMVSSSGEAAVSGISLVDSINVMFVVLFTGLGVGGAVVTTQYIGSRNYAQARASANHLVYLSAGVATAIMVVLLCFVPQMLELVYGSIATDVFGYAKTYFYITLLSYPFYAIGTTVAALLRCMAKNRQSTTLTTGVNLLNFLGNALFVYGLDMSVAGAALSTTLSRVFFAAVGLALLHRKKDPVYFEGLLRFRIDRKMMKRIFSVGMTASVQNGLFQFGKVLLSSLISTFGTVFIAVHSVAFSILNFGWTLVGTYSTVALTVVGQCIGAGEPEQAKRNTNKLLAAGTVTLLISFGLLFLFRDYVVQLFDFNQETLELSAYYVGTGALFTVASLYSYSFAPASAFRAAGDLYFPLIVTIGSMFVFRVGLSYLLATVFHMGLMSVWIGMFADWVFHSIINIIRMRSGKWLRKKLI